MHLLAATPGTVDDGAEPVDLRQTPADVVVISAADTELAALSAARAGMDAPPRLRLASMMYLQHPMSVDLHLDACAVQSKLVIARVLGGLGYWKYGVEQYAARLQAAGVPLALLPGDDKPDPELRLLSTVDDTDYDALWAYLIEGGPTNAVRFLDYAKAMIADTPRPPAAEPLLRTGLYWPGQGIVDMEAVRGQWSLSNLEAEPAPMVPLIFYRALVQGAGLDPINRMVAALLDVGLNPMPVFVASLKDPLSVATLMRLFEQVPPDVILNCTAFAAGSPEAPGTSPLAAPAANMAPVLQVVLAAQTAQAWDSGLSGLSARDIAMNVALPEVDGRVLSRAVSFKGEAFYDDATQCPIVSYQAQADRIAFVADLAKRWTDLRRTAPSDRRVAFVLANYPNKDGRLANGVGLDTPASVVAVLKALAANGYAIENAPADGDALMQTLLNGPTNWLTDRAVKEGGEVLPLAVYKQHYNQLPQAVRAQIEDRWGGPEDDPFLEASPNTPGFRLSIHRYGAALLGIQPARGYNIDPVETYHSPDLPPPHHYLAFYFWLRHSFAAHAIVHMGKHGNMEWLPGKALALSEECLPEAVFGPTPHMYPFIVNDPGEGTQAKRRAQAVIVDHLTPPLTRAETYGPLHDLEALVDEYYEAAGVDTRRIAHLRGQILSRAASTGLDQDIGFEGDQDGDIAKLDAYLCALKESQIRDGLHIFGASPEGQQALDLTVALARVPRGGWKWGGCLTSAGFGRGFWAWL